MSDWKFELVPPPARGTKTQGNVAWGGPLLDCIGCGSASVTARVRCLLWAKVSTSRSTLCRPFEGPGAANQAPRLVARDLTESASLKGSVLRSSTTAASIHAPFSDSTLRVNLAGFAFNGVLMSVYGPMLETVALRFHVSLATAGALVGVHFLGALIGAAGFWRLLYHRPPRRLLRSTYFILAIGFASVIIASIAGIFPLLCIGVLAGGIGFGGLDYGLSQIFASGYQERKTEMLNLLHGCFGLGTALGPLALGLTGASQYPAIFAVGFLIALSGMAAGQAGRIAQRPAIAEARDSNGMLGFPLLSYATVLFIILYLFHVAVQGTIGEWEPTQLRAFGFRPEAASLWTAAYWSGIAISRLAIAHGYVRGSPRSIVVACCAGTCLTAAATFFPAARPIAYVVFGLFIGPIFPVGLSWLSGMLRDPNSGIAAVVITSLIGGIIFPPLVGFGIEGYGVSIVPFTMLFISLLAAVTAWMIPGQHR